MVFDCKRDMTKSTYLDRTVSNITIAKPKMTSIAKSYPLMTARFDQQPFAAYEACKMHIIKAKRH